MKISEKKFIFDLASILMAVGIIMAAIPVFIDVHRFIHVIPLIYGLSAVLMGILTARAKLSGRKGLALICSAVAILLAGLCISTVLASGGA